MSNDVRKAVREMILSQFMGTDDPQALADDVSLDRKGIVDSARSMELILFVEETFGITVDTEDAVPENFDSVNNIVSFVERKRTAPG